MRDWLQALYLRLSGAADGLRLQNEALRVALKIRTEEKGEAVAELMREREKHVAQQDLESYGKKLGETDADFAKRRAADVDAIRSSLGLKALLHQFKEREDGLTIELLEASPDKAEDLRRQAWAMREARRMIVMAANQLRLGQAAQERAAEAAVDDWARFRKSRGVSVDTAAPAS